MVRAEKKATQDGTFKVYLDNSAVAWGLSSSAADALIENYAAVDTCDRLMRSFAQIPSDGVSQVSAPDARYSRGRHRSMFPSSAASLFRSERQP
ncbi:hypothetical protein [Microvirga sp. G4-2]|uniref:hypothetical protein n=1 Tax=Microvirga sp. G4-2 TaxID=3434467 RepID=UPI0040441EBD